MIKAILLDLDGTIVQSTKSVHKSALEIALDSQGVHFDTKKLEALSTKQKLAAIKQELGPDSFDEFAVNRTKQAISKLVLQNMNMFDPEIKRTVDHLSRDFLIGCCTNSTRETQDLILDKMQLFSFDVIMSNEDAAPKPSPDIYLAAMKYLCVEPDQCVIVEDSPVGLEAAYASGAHVYPVQGPQDVTISKIIDFIQKLSLKAKPYRMWNHD